VEAEVEAVPCEEQIVAPNVPAPPQVPSTNRPHSRRRSSAEGRGGGVGLPQSRSESAFAALWLQGSEPQKVAQDRHVGELRRTSDSTAMSKADSYSAFRAQPPRAPASARGARPSSGRRNEGPMSARTQRSAMDLDLEVAPQRQLAHKNNPDVGARLALDHHQPMVVNKQKACVLPSICLSSPRAEVWEVASWSKVRDWNHTPRGVW